MKVGRQRKKARRKQKIVLVPRASRGSGGRPEARRGGFRFAAKVLAAAAGVCALVAAFAAMTRYAERDLSPAAERISLVDVPDWVGDELKRRVREAAGTASPAGIAEAASAIQQSIKRCVPWLSDVTVQVRDRVIVSGTWRRPLSVLRERGSLYYVDSDCVVLDYVPIPELAAVAVTGLAPHPLLKPGMVLEAGDIAAAIELLESLARMDRRVVPDKPLRAEIENIDVSNYNGRMDPHKPHIILFAKDRTKIIWGAEVGCWQRYLESPDEEKLAKLYSYYEQYGSLMDRAEYIDLRSPLTGPHIPY